MPVKKPSVNKQTLFRYIVGQFIRCPMPFFIIIIVTNSAFLAIFPPVSQCVPRQQKNGELARKKEVTAARPARKICPNRKAALHYLFCPSLYAKYGGHLTTSFREN